jgi:DNA-binding NarL/FixJ family response regulator
MPTRVMLVEDNVSFRRVLKAILNARLPSVKISEAEGEGEALNIIKKDMPDFIFMDLKLAEGSGLSLTRKIKRVSPNTKVVVMTTHDCPEYEKAAYQSGADGFITKESASPDEIVRFVKSIADGKSQK